MTIVFEGFGEADLQGSCMVCILAIPKGCPCAYLHHTPFVNDCLHLNGFVSIFGFLTSLMLIVCAFIRISYVWEQVKD